MIKIICDLCGKENDGSFREYVLPTLKDYFATCNGIKLAKFQHLEDSQVHLCRCCSERIALMLNTKG